MLFDDKDKRDPNEFCEGCGWFEDVGLILIFLGIVILPLVL